MEQKELFSQELAEIPKQQFVDIMPKNSQGELLYKSFDEYKRLVNTNPKPNWIKQNKYSQNANYLPIGIVEELLSMFFPYWGVEMHGEPKILGNCVVISVHLIVFNPILNREIKYAGVGAVPIEVESGASPLDFNKINSKALHKNVPAALGFATSNAAKKIGKIFGSHLNRKESL